MARSNWRKTTGSRKCYEDLTHWDETAKAAQRATLPCSCYRSKAIIYTVLQTHLSGLFVHEAFGHHSFSEADGLRNPWFTDETAVWTKRTAILMVHQKAQSVAATSMMMKAHRLPTQLIKDGVQADRTPRNSFGVVVCHRQCSLSQLTYAPIVRRIGLPEQSKTPVADLSSLILKKEFMPVTG